MSFILDALRKSEHDRQRQSGPGIADIRTIGGHGRFPLWAVAIGALLLINIVVVLLLVFRGESQPASGAAANPPAAAAVAATESPAPNAAAERQSQPSAVIPLPQRVEPQMDEPEPAQYEGPPARASAPARERPLADPELDARAGEDDRYATLPTVNDIVSQRGERAVPELHLDIHVYATRPAERFVFLNMRKYREGGSTPEGTVIERITRDGVVLNHRGVRFMMPRQ